MLFPRVVCYICLCRVICEDSSTKWLLPGWERRKQFHNSTVELQKPGAINSRPMSVNRGNQFIKITLEKLEGDYPVTKCLYVMWPLTSMDCRKPRLSAAFLNVYTLCYSFHVLDIFHICVHKNVTMTWYPAHSALLACTSVALCM